MSTHEVLVVQVEEIKKHENAEFLEILKISGYDYSVVARKGQFQVGQLGCFIEPDYKIKTTRPEFAFLYDGKRNELRVSARKLRGVWSEGLLIEAKPHHKLGDNVMEELEITRYEPPPQKNAFWSQEGANLQAGLFESEPENYPYKIPIYDLENYRKNTYAFTEDDDVYYSTKIHGSNARFMYWNGKIYCGTRKNWIKKDGLPLEYKDREGNVIQKETPKSSWWEGLKQNPWLEEFCRKNPGMIVYAEIFGTSVQGHKFHYGFPAEKFGIRVFDVLRAGKWVCFDELTTNPFFEQLKLVPILYKGKHNPKLLAELAELPEDFNGVENHIREGIVIKPFQEKYHERLGRIALKYVSSIYLMKS